MALIDINTIISTFNERGTLLKWLQKLEAALASSTLETVTVNTTPDGAGAQFVFNFSDDTHIETPYITLPRGATGAAGKDGTNGKDGVGITAIEAGAPYVAGDQTITPLTVSLTEGEPVALTVKAKNGSNGVDGTNGAAGKDGTNGKDGVGITAIEAGAPYVAGDQTITPLTVSLTEGEPEYLNVFATNGAAAAAGKDGVGITEITEGDAYVTGDQTITPIAVHLTEGEPVALTVKAKNGSNGVDGTNGAAGMDGNGIVTVHALRHYEQDNETITVVEVVTDDATNPQFEVHAQNGTSPRGITFTLKYNLGGVLFVEGISPTGGSVTTTIYDQQVGTIEVLGGTAVLLYTDTGRTGELAVEQGTIACNGKFIPTNEPFSTSAIIFILEEDTILNLS